MKPFTPSLRAVLLWCGLSIPMWCVPVSAEEAPAPVTFEDHVAGILRKNCAQCHGDSKQKAGLHFGSYSSVMKGGSGGAAVVAGRASASPLFNVLIKEDRTERMPPDADPLPAAEIELIKKWIDSGLREHAGSSAVAMRTLGFKPADAAESAQTGPPPLPSDLPSVERASLQRPFPVLAMASSPRAAVAAASGYGVIELFEPGSARSLGGLAFGEGEPFVLRFSKSGRRLLAAGGRPVETGVAAVYDVLTGKRLAAVGDEPDAVLAADLSPDERMVAVGGASRLVKVFSTENGSLLYSLDKHTDWITALSFSPDGRYLISGDRGGNIHLWEAKTGGVVLPLSEHKGSIRSLSWRSDSGVVASCGEDGLIVWWDVSDGFPVANKPNAHPPKRAAGVYGKVANGVLDCSFGPRGELVSCGRDRVVRIWDSSGAEKKVFQLPESDPTGAAGRKIRVFPTRVAVSFDGKTILAGDSAGGLHSWKLD